MAVLSAVLWFLAHHSILSLPLLVIFFAVLGSLLAGLRKKKGGVGWIGLGFLAGMANIFLGHFVNALFLNAVGVTGRAVIVHSRETSSTLNDQHIWDYDAVLKTVDGRDVPFSFDTMSASIYPIRNQILIPPEGEIFQVKYVPGFARNAVILSDASRYGNVLEIERDREPVDKAAAQLAFSPKNVAFQEEYRRALQQFLDRHRGDADPALVQEFEQKLESLGPAGK